MRGRSWTDDDLRRAVAQENNHADVCRVLGLRTHRSRHVENRIIVLKLSTKHFLPGRIGRSGPQKTIKLDDILEGRRWCGSQYLKKLLLQAALIDYHCKLCGLFEWQGKSISLHLDHIDGDHRNNTLSNLRLLCPNCHSQTPTYGSKNKRSRVRKTYEYACAVCQRPISRGAVYCITCAPRGKDTYVWPPFEETAGLVKTVGPLTASRKLGVSRNRLYEYLRKAGFYASADSK